MTYTFHDEGGQFDGDGKMGEVLTAADKRAFSALGAKLTRQYEQFEPLPGHKINGDDQESGASLREGPGSPVITLNVEPSGTGGDTPRPRRGAA